MTDGPEGLPRGVAEHSDEHIQSRAPVSQDLRLSPLPRPSVSGSETTLCFRSKLGQSACVRHESREHLQRLTQRFCQM